MDQDPASFFCTLYELSKDSASGPSECYRLLSILNNNFTDEQLSPTLVDLYLFEIFNNKGSSLPVIVGQVLPTKKFKNTVIKSLELVYTLVNNFPSKLIANIVVINDLCLTVIKSLLVSSDEKVKALELLILGFEKCNKSIELSDHYTNIFNVLHKSLSVKKGDSIEEKVYTALGVFAKRCSYLVSQPNELQKILLDNLECQMLKKDQSQKLIGGLFTALMNFCECFPLNQNSDEEKIKKLYFYIRKLGDPKSRIKIANRAALLFLKSNISLFKHFIIKDCKAWHSKLYMWIAEFGLEEKKVAFQVLISFYKTMGAILETEAKQEYVVILKSFLKIITTNLGENASTYERHLAINGIRFLTGACYKQLAQNEVTVFFIKILQRFEQTYVFGLETNKEEWEYLPDYLQIISNLLQFKNASSNELFSLERGIISMIKIYPQIPYNQRIFVVDSFVSTLFFMRKNKEIFESFCFNVVYQSVVWSCSHHHKLDANLIADSNEKIITVQSYLPFWSSLFNIRSAIKYDKQGIDFDARCKIEAKITENLVKTLFVLTNKLNVSVTQNEDQIECDLNKMYKINEVNDYAIFLNVVDFYEEILQKVDYNLLDKCICKLINFCISKCFMFPLISGFYKFLACFLKISNKCNVFDEVNLESTPDISATFDTLLRFVRHLLSEMQQYKDELLISCLKILLECPIAVVKEILPICAPSFGTVFAIGRNYNELANMGLNTLEHWQEHLTPSEMDGFLKEVLPSLDWYLRSRSLSGFSASSVEKRRKTAQTLKKRKVVVEIESNLIIIQRRILNFIGQQNTKLCQEFVSTDNNIETLTWSKTNYLKLTLPFKDTKLDIYLDTFVPRIIELALYCTDRKTRITSCEILQGIVVIFLGTEKQLSEGNRSELSTFLEKIFKSLLILGCDVDDVVHQLFEPMVFQIIHWYTNPMHHRSEYVAIIIDALMESVSDPMDSSLRDFSGKCINEFLKWTIKQTNEATLASDPANLKVLVKKVRFFSSHPDPYKKLGSALIFNNIYRELREERALFNMFWIELLHIFVTSLADFDSTLHSENIVNQIKSAIQHLKRGFVEKHALFNKPDNCRRVPTEIGQSESVTLKDVVLWLLKNTNSLSSSCREVSIDLFEALAPFVSGFKNMSTFLHKNIKGVSEWVTETYEDFLRANTTLDSLMNKQDTSVLFTWLKSLLVALEGYSFLIKNDFLSEIELNNTYTIKSLQYFVENVADKKLAEALNLIENKTWNYTLYENEKFYKIKEKVIQKSLIFLIRVALNHSLKTCNIWNTETWNFLTNAVFVPEIYNMNQLMIKPRDDQREVLCFLLNATTKLENKNIEEFAKHIDNYIQSNFSVNIDLKKNVKLKEMNLIKGLLFLQKTKLNDKLNIEKYNKNLVNSLIKNFVSESNVTIINNLQNSTIEYCELVLKFALTNNEELNSFIGYLYHSGEIEYLEESINLKLGPFLVLKFEETIYTSLAQNFAHFFNTSLENYTFSDVNTYICGVLKYLASNVKTTKTFRENVLQSIQDKWSTLTTLFMESKINIDLSLELIQCLLSVLKEEKACDFEDVCDYLITLLMLENGVQEFGQKIDILILLMGIYKDREEENTNLSLALTLIKESFTTPTIVPDASKSMLFNRLLSKINTIKSSQMLLFIFDVYISFKKRKDLVTITEDLEKTLFNMDPNAQAKCLKLFFKFSTNLVKKDADTLCLIRSICQALLNFCNIEAEREFFVNNIEAIVKILQEETNEINLFVKGLCFALIESLFIRLPLTSENDEPEIGQAVFPEENTTKKLLQFLFKMALNSCKECPQIENENIECLRLFKCYGYNALVSIVTNSLKNENFVPKLFTRSENNVDTLWDSLVDTKKVYTFSNDFDSYPKKIKRLTSIRSEVKSKKKLSGTSQSSSIQYLESQRLFNSSLSEDISRYDFSSTKVRTQVLDNNESSTQFAASEVMLDDLDVNAHECMGTVCGLVHFLFESGMTPIPDEDDNLELPVWMMDIRNLLLNDNTKANVKIFWVKVIDNTSSLFKHYGKYFVEPLLKFISDKCAGSSINYFVTDIIAVLTSWSINIDTAQTSEKQLLSKVVLFFFENVNNERRDIFKYHLELIKLLVETFKTNIEVPYDHLLERVKDTKSPKVDIVIHLSSIFLANKILPCTPNNAEWYLKCLAQMLGSDHKTTYKPCAETIGLFLNLIDEELKSNLEAMVSGSLNVVQDLEKFALCLESVAIHYPNIINETFLARIFSKLCTQPDSLKCVILKIIIKRTEILSSLSDFTWENWSNLINSEHLDVQIITLEIMLKTLDILETTSQFNKIIEAICNKIASPNDVCRNLMYDILIHICNKNVEENKYRTVVKTCKEHLLKGLSDKNFLNKEKVFHFWKEYSQFPENLSDILLFIMNEFYRPNNEDCFLNHGVYFLLNILEKSDDYNTLLFEFPLEDCNFEEYVLQLNWRLQNPSVVPLFAETVRSFTQEAFQLSVSDLNIVRQTQNNLTFAPTQSLRSDTSQFTSSESSLYVGSQKSTTDFKNPNLIDMSDGYKVHKKRFLKNKDKISRQHAHYEVKKAVKKVEKHQEQAKEREKKITIFRNYRTGDLPDIQIMLSAVLKPLQMLALSDTHIAKMLFTTIVETILSKTDKNNMDFIRSLENQIRYIFENTNQFNTNLIRTLFDIVLHCHQEIKLKPELVCSVSISSGLISVGTLLLEEYLNCYEDELDTPVSAKRSRGAETTGEITLWTKLAELYKEMNEWDVVRSIFLEKMNCNETVKKAIESESQKQWRDAEEYYQKLITEDLWEGKDFYYESYFKCLAHLGEWDGLPKAIDGVVNKTNENRTWNALWDGGWNQQKLLPWYITAQVNNMLFSKGKNASFLEDVNKSLNDADKCAYLRGNFSEQLCLLWILNKDINTANQYVQTYFDSFLDNWQILDPMFYNLRLSKLLQLRNIVDISNFIQIYNKLEPLDLEERFPKIKKTFDKQSDVYPSIVLHETKILYSQEFVGLICEKIKTFEDEDYNSRISELKAINFNLNLGLINAALDENNFYMARKYFKNAGDTKNIEMQVIASKMLYIKANLTKQENEAAKFLMGSLKMAKNLLLTQNQNNYTANVIIFEILQDLSKIMTSKPGLLNVHKLEILELLDEKNINNSNDVAVFGANFLKTFASQYENEINLRMGEEPNTKDLENAAKVYVTLAYFIRNQQVQNFEDFILFVLRGMRLGSKEARQLFPCILIQKDLGTVYRDLFVKESRNIPTWMFLGWIPQLLSNVDTPNVCAISHIVIKIAEAYPQAIMMQYRVSKESYKLKDPKCLYETTNLTKRLDELLLNKDVEIFLKALTNISVPHATLKYYLIKLVTFLKANNIQEARRTHNVIIKELFSEQCNSRNASCMKGNLYSKAQIMSLKIEILKLKVEATDKAYAHLKQIFDKIDTCLKDKNTILRATLLKDYCPWLANFSANKFNYDLEIPGQYTGEKLPLTQHHVKISGFNPTVRIMDSVRKPIKITIIGNDTKEYSFLIKFGEDIRQDQRIEQLFSLMNNAFQEDVVCSQQQLSLMTYQVIPLTPNLGIIEWVNDCTSLQDFLLRSMVKDSKPHKIFTESLPEKFHKFIYGTSKAKSDTDAYGMAAIKYSKDKIVPFFKGLVNEIEHDLLRKSFWKISVSTECFIALRQNFIKSYATMCVCHWLLGIGDRHLSNTLISMKNGKVLGIDFGHAFGTGTQIQPIPELVPFRLTPQIVAFMEPLREQGHFKETMIHCLRTLRSCKDLLLATMNVFIEEPSLDWLENATKLGSESEESHEWFPAVKIDQAKRKFNGIDPSVIFIEDLKAGHAHRSQYMKAYVNLIRQTSLHSKGEGEILTEEEQVNCLIAQATDYNLLPRMYVGWRPWI